MRHKNPNIKPHFGGASDAFVQLQKGMKLNSLLGRRKSEILAVGIAHHRQLQFEGVW